MHDESLWKDVPGHSGYQIHPDGEVRSFWSRGGDVRKTPPYITEKNRILKKGLGGAGYYTVMLGRGKSKNMHRLLAEIFIPNPETKKTVNHKNGNKADNRLENLEWATYSENILHACRVLGKRVREKSATSKLTENDAREIRSLISFGAMSKDLAEAYGVSRSTICHLLKGRTWVTLK